MFLRVCVFYVLTFFFILLLGGLQQETGLLPQEIGLAQWGPGIAALLMLVIFRKDGFKINFITKDTPILRYAYAALIPFGAALAVFLIAAVVQIKPSPGAPVYNSLPLMVLWMPLGALGEELGWRGYLNKLLDTRLRGLVSALVVGVLWFPIHMSFFANGPIFVLVLALVILSYSVVIYALVQDTGFNVLLAAVFHVVINLGNLLFLSIIHETALMLVNALVWVTVAAVTILMKREIFFSAKPKALGLSTSETTD
jgi:uncharacterized protein